MGRIMTVSEFTSLTQDNPSAAYQIYRTAQERIAQLTGSCEASLSTLENLRKDTIDQTEKIKKLQEAIGDIWDEVGSRIFSDEKLEKAVKIIENRSGEIGGDKENNAALMKCKVIARIYPTYCLATKRLCSRASKVYKDAIYAYLDDMLTSEAMRPIYIHSYSMRHLRQPPEIFFEQLKNKEKSTGKENRDYEHHEKQEGKAERKDEKEKGIEEERENKKGFTQPSSHREDDTIDRELDDMFS